MRTDDVLVDTLLGDGDALDAYSQGLQDQAVMAEQVKNEFLSLKNELLEKIVNAPKADTAQELTGIYHQLFGKEKADEPIS